MLNNQSTTDFVLPVGGGSVGFIGIPSERPPGTRENTGNFLHGFAARHIIGQNQNIPLNNLTDEMIEKYRSELTHIAFITANAIRGGNNDVLAAGHRKVADAIEKLDLPVIVFGLGAQAKIGQAIPDMDISAETKRLLSVISHYSPKIAVRGEFTADLCKHLGVHNIEVIGCQSCFISRRPDFKIPELTETPNADRLVVNVTYHARELPLIKEAMSEGAAFIGQTEHFEYELAQLDEGATIDNLPENVRSLISPQLYNIFKSGRLDFSGYHRWVREKFVQYYSMPPWFAKLSSGEFDACIGTRFHGNMAAMQSGVPSLWIVHDSRTQEFCDYLGLPQAPLKALSEEKTVGDIFDKYYRTDGFAKKYQEAYTRFYAYLTEHGVPHKLAAPLRN
ncbi:polysaccharide pyruvyl transferase [Paracoccus pantotrophus]|uniref:Polysaccharide pyruvyl transferase n=1 Tax=Paracoccus pantotrophus TaxID=82367 RepID=A0AAE6NT75_PARPN|nr:polysaccharide pyruvyl transferase family protein [Paracoccus pantotrophus]QFG36191.1 polysaccharide pyruvyl transferase family protein [Paracoccus pantotrophus]RKS43236.1 polysaccharide pyruvyl transferase [Paracoccus pantotrophus]